MTFNWGPCFRRASAIESLESSHIGDHDLERLFDFLEFSGRWGGRNLFLAALAACAGRWMPGRPITFLDIRCGRGDLSRAIAAWARRKKIEVQITAVDHYGRVIQMARKKTVGVPEIVFDVRDITDPIFLQAQQFDYVVSDLTLHHQDMDQSVTFLKKANLLAKRGLIIGDFLRDVRGLATLTTLAPLWRNEVVKHDASLSVKRAYTQREAKQMAHKAGLDYIQVTSHFGLRVMIMGERGLVLSGEMRPVTGLAGT